MSKELAAWINERESIRLKREAGLPPPWSDDEVFNVARFTNVRREDDKTTKWMRKCWSDHKSPAWWFLLGRMINHIPTLQEIVIEGARELGHIELLLRNREAQGEKVFGGAYTVGMPKSGGDMIEFTMDLVEDMRSTPPNISGRMLHHAWRELVRYNGLGSFMASQMIADMKNTPFHLLAEAADWHGFCAMGRREDTLAVLLGRPISAGSFPRALISVVRDTEPLLGAGVTLLDNQDWHACIREFGKYTKIKEGTGRARNRFDPRAAFDSDQRARQG